MFDRIEKKVEQIRKKPRYIRKRYLWFWVTLIMFFVIFVWVISIQITFYNMGDNEEENDTSTTNQTFTDLQESIKNFQTENSSPPSTSIDDLLEQSDTVTTSSPEPEL